jgi:hypothetical protein
VAHRSQIVCCAILASVLSSGRALAVNYQCRLPLVTSSEVGSGGPKTETTQDDTVLFVVRVAPAGGFAIIEGMTYHLVKGSNYQAFVAVATGLSSGVDVLTIYDTRVAGGLFSVESRHLTILGKPLASQMVGVCAPL